MHSVKLIIIALLCSITAAAQYVQPMRYDHYSFTQQVNIGVGSARTTAASAYLEVGPATGATKGIIMPRVKTTLRDALVAPATGLVIYNSTTNRINYYNGSTWVDPTGTTYTFPYSVTAPGNAVQLENDTTASPANYFYGRNSAGRRGWYPQSGIAGVNIYNTDGTLTGNRTISGAGYSLSFDNINKFKAGTGTVASANYSTAFGYYTTSSGLYSSTFGSSTTASGIYSTAMGLEGIASGHSSTVMGRYNKSKSFAGTVIGTFNDSTDATSPTTFNTANRAFEIGIGTADAARANAMTVLFNGNVGIGTITPSKILHTVGTIRHESLGTASGDTTTNKPVGINSSGDIIPMTYWPGGGGGSGITTLAAIGSSPNANGATISGSTLNLEPASASFGGVVTTGTQTLAGNKTLSGITTLGNYMVLPSGTIAGGARIQSSSATGYFGLSESNALCQMYWNNNHISVSTGQVLFNVAGVDRFTATGTAAVFNDNSQNYDFRVEGDTDPNLIFADASIDSVGIGTATPLYKLHVDGTGYFSDLLTINNGLEPLSDNALALGNTSKRWATIFTGNIENSSSVNVKTGGATNYVFGSDGSLSIKKTTAAHSILEVGGSFATKYTATATGITLDGGHSIVNVTATGQTITLPTAASITGREYTIINSSSGNTTIATTSSETIGNFTTSTTYTLASDKSVTVVSDGSHYKIKMSN